MINVQFFIRSISSQIVLVVILFIYLIIYSFICYLFIYLFIYSFIHLFLIYLSIYWKRMCTYVVRIWMWLEVCLELLFIRVMHWKFRNDSQMVCKWKEWMFCCICFCYKLRIYLIVFNLLCCLRLFSLISLLFCSLFCFCFCSLLLDYCVNKTIK